MVNTTDDREIVLRPVGEIYAAINACMKDIDSIEKGRTNTQGSGFKYRGIDDIYNSLHGVLAKHGVFTVPEVVEMKREERTSKSGGNLNYAILTINFRFYARDGSYITATMIGEAMDSGDKASNKAQSVAHKYAFLQVFAIPTQDEKDPDGETHETESKKQAGTSQPASGTKRFPTEKQIQRLYAIASASHWTHDDVHRVLKGAGISSTKDLPLERYEPLIEHIQTNAKKAKSTATTTPPHSSKSDDTDDIPF